MASMTASSTSGMETTGSHHLLLQAESTKDPQTAIQIYTKVIECDSKNSKTMALLLTWLFCRWSIEGQGDCHPSNWSSPQVTQVNNDLY